MRCSPFVRPCLTAGLRRRPRRFLLRRYGRRDVVNVDGPVHYHGRRRRWEESTCVRDDDRRARAHQRICRMGPHAIERPDAGCCNETSSHPDHCSEDNDSRGVNARLRGISTQHCEGARGDRRLFQIGSRKDHLRYPPTGIFRTELKRARLTPAPKVPNGPSTNGLMALRRRISSSSAPRSVSSQPRR